MKTTLLKCILFFLPWPSLAFTVTATKNLSGFQSNTVNVYLNADECHNRLTGELLEAIQLWNNAPLSALHLQFKGVNSTPPENLGLWQQKEDIIISCTNHFSELVKESIDSPSCSGPCLSGVSGGTKQLIYTDGVLEKSYVLLNSNPFDPAQIHGRPRSQRVLIIAHELGHAVGLGHSPHKEALMYYQVSDKAEIKLHFDDIYGVSYLYPRNVQTGCGQIHVKTVNRTTSLLMIILLFLPLAIACYVRGKFSRANNKLRFQN